MRILHTADLHLGQIIYHYYDRADEHLHFFAQLEDYIKEYEPDALIVAGDIFDIPQPSAMYWRMFTEAFVKIRNLRPQMAIVIVAGNHDSPSRLQSNSAIWSLANAKMVGTPPPPDFTSTPGWEEDFILRLPTGYIITLPFMNSDRLDPILALQEYVAKENKENLPVIMTGHLAVTGCNFAGHDFDLGTLRTTDIEKFGTSFDYLALGHIHRPQTLNHSIESYSESVAYLSPVVRYSGSALHVSADETYPHSVSLVDIDRHGGEVKIKLLKIRQLRHFINLPEEGAPFQSQKEIFKTLKKWVKKNSGYYVRLRVKQDTDLSSDFTNNIYTLFETEGTDLRYNPKIVWEKEDSNEDDEENLALKGNNEESNILDVEEIQQISDPLKFIRLTADRYPSLNLDALADAFVEINDELRAMDEE